MIISQIRKKGSITSRCEPEEVVFQEPGLKITNKAEGKGHSKKSANKKEKELNRRVQKIFNKERSEGNALPAVLKDLELTTALRTQVFELGASTIELDKRGKALEKWKKRHRAPNEMLTKWNSVHKSTLTYPKLIDKAFEDKAELFAAKEREYFGDDMVDQRRVRRKHKSGIDVPSHLYGKHLSRTKVGKFKNGVLKLTNQDVRNMKYRSDKHKPHRR